MNFKKNFMRLWKFDASRKVSWIIPYLRGNEKIIDLGCGPCFLSSFLMEKGYEVTPVDVQNLSAIRSIEPIIYDGDQLPFEKKAYDVALLLTILHHINDFKDTILEAKRVSKRIIIIEDIYYNT